MSWDDPHAWRASYDAWKLDAMDAYSYGDGPSMESVRELEEEMRDLVEENETLRAFVKTLVENDPNADAADGVTVIDVWRKEVLEAFPPPPVAFECEDCIEEWPLEYIMRTCYQTGWDDRVAAESGAR